MRKILLFAVLAMVLAPITGGRTTASDGGLIVHQLRYCRSLKVSPILWQVKFPLTKSLSR